MTTDTLALPAALGGTPAFPEGLPLTRVQVPDRATLLERLGAVLDSGQLTNGRTVAELEEAAAELLDVPHVVAVSNCTAGLMLVLQAAGVADGRPVVMPGFTFSATAHAAHWAAWAPRCSPRPVSATSPWTPRTPPPGSPPPTARPR